MDGMDGGSISGPKKPLVPPPRERQAIRRRVGAFIRARRKELGLTLGEVVFPLGYTNLASAWKIEKGLEGLPAKRVYAWADILEVPRDAFFRFVMGETERMDVPKSAAKTEDSKRRLTTAEAELLAAYRRLPPKSRLQLRKAVREFETAARSEKRPRKR